MGYDSRIYVGWYASRAPEPDGLYRFYPEITIDMPRLGWQWAAASRTLRSSRHPHRFRVMDPSEPDGYAVDAYEQPLIALDPKRLLRYLEKHHSETLKLPTVAALTAALDRVRKERWQGETGCWVVIHYGH